MKSRDSGMGTHKEMAIQDEGGDQGDNENQVGRGEAWQIFPSTTITNTFLLHLFLLLPLLNVHVLQASILEWTFDPV